MEARQIGAAKGGQLCKSFHEQKLCLGPCAWQGIIPGRYCTVSYLTMYEPVPCRGGL